MAIKYDFYRTPPARGEGEDAKEKYYARVVGGKTVEMDTIVPHIQQRCTLAKGDVTAVVDELGVEIVNQLCEGNHVYLPGIGYFSLSLSAPQDASPDVTHSQQIHVKKIEFRADQQLKEAVKEKANFKRSQVKNHSTMLSDEEIEHLLRKTFRETPYLSRPEFCALTGLSRMTAQRHLDQLVEAGKVLKKGSFRCYSYQPTTKFMNEDK